ncbi:ArsB/NhaD family transporter [Pseudoroseomonas sp. WGS1072]|uniref:ArsB/NhaD family transporter n=1 Tax=Roseomonas sp. WGS1072 TaxID=3366816 RepID=UPI003BF388AE
MSGVVSAAPVIWTIAALTTLGVLLRPFRWPEAVWAVAGAALVVALGLLPPAEAPPVLAGAILIAVDLGPNLSVTGSLATILWLVALRREGLEIGAWPFLRIGLLVMPPALLHEPF